MSVYRQGKKESWGPRGKSEDEKGGRKQQTNRNDKTSVGTSFVFLAEFVS